MLAWASVIAWLSSDGFSGDHTGDLFGPLLAAILPGAGAGTIEAVHAAVRKLAHLTEYAILAALLVRALSRPGRTATAVAALALALSAGWAALDEWHQSFVPSRTAALGDVAIDTVGAALGLAAGLAAVGTRRRPPARRVRAAR